MKIISPCDQNFGKMKKEGNGRYCGSCQKVVVDFTRMSNAELIGYFKEHKNENICGRVKSFQMGKQNAFESFLFTSKQFIADKINITPLRVGLLAILSGLMAFTTSCMGKVMYDHPAAYNNDTTAKDTVKTKSVPAKKQ